MKVAHTREVRGRKGKGQKISRSASGIYGVNKENVISAEENVCKARRCARNTMKCSKLWQCICVKAKGARSQENG